MLVKNKQYAGSISTITEPTNTAKTSTKGKKIIAKNNAGPR